MLRFKPGHFLGISVPSHSVYCVHLLTLLDIAHGRVEIRQKLSYQVWTKSWPVQLPVVRCTFIGRYAAIPTYLTVQLTTSSDGGHTCTKYHSMGFSLRSKIKILICLASRHTVALCCSTALGCSTYCLCRWPLSDTSPCSASVPWWEARINLLSPSDMTSSTVPILLFEIHTKPLALIMATFPQQPVVHGGAIYSRSSLLLPFIALL